MDVVGCGFSWHNMVPAFGAHSCLLESEHEGDHVCYCAARRTQASKPNSIHLEKIKKADQDWDWEDLEEEWNEDSLEERKNGSK